MKRMNKKIVGWIMLVVMLAAMLTVTACSVKAAESTHDDIEAASDGTIEKKSFMGIGSDLIPDAEVTTLTESSSPLLWAILLFIAVADFACLIRIGIKSMKNNYKSDAKKS